MVGQSLSTVVVGPQPADEPLPSQWFGGWTAFLLSTILHTITLLLLALLVIPEGEKPSLDLLIATNANDANAADDTVALSVASQSYEAPDLTEPADTPVSVATLEAPEITPDLSGNDPDAVEDTQFNQDYERWLMLAGNQRQLPNQASRGKLTASQTNSASNASGQVASLSGATEPNDPNDPTKPRPRLSKSANYYGIEASGTRFVFVVDASTSMRGIRWQSAVRELMKCISELSPDSEYYLIFFSDKTSFLFNQSPGKTEFQTPEQETLKKTQRWILSQDLGKSTRPQAALYTAVHMQPDAIFLLSDGEFRDNSLLWIRQLAINASKTDQKIPPIHSIGLFSDMGLSTLMEVSQLTHGEFRQIRSPFGF